MNFEVDSSPVKPADENTAQLIPRFHFCETISRGPMAELLIPRNGEKIYVYSFKLLSLWEFVTQQ